MCTKFKEFWIFGPKEFWIPYLEVFYGIMELLHGILLGMYVLVYVYNVDMCVYMLRGRTRS